MALDGIYLSSLIHEFRNKMLNAKIDKINQPEKDEIILTVRKDRKNLKLLISASSKFPRIHFTEISKPNPLKASMFTMVLRKYLLGGIITNIEQLDGDRIVKLSVENTDELGFFSKYILIVEIMGRHSNITLIRDRDNKIMEAIKHIHSDVNSFRVTYPGASYVYPPASSRVNPFNIDNDVYEDIISSISDISDESIFSKIFTGVSKPLSKNLYLSLIENSININKDVILDSFKNFILNLENNYSYRIYKSNESYKDFHCVSLDYLFKDLKYKEIESPSLLLEEFYFTKDKQDRLSNRALDLFKLLNNNIDRCKNKATKLMSVLEECSKKENFKIKGDLLTSYIYMLKKGQSEISLQNFYSENPEEYMTIALNENKSPSENVQYYYKKYNKLKKSEEGAYEQLEKNEEELKYLNSVITNIENCDSYEDIDSIKKELIETGYLRFKAPSGKQKKEKENKPLKFTTTSGIDIYVGKNNIQNDFLSLKFANKNHYWFHAKDIPGSHVILTTNSPSDRDLEEAAIIAAFYSKGKESSKVSVDYTLVKNLKKPAQSKPGMVIYHTNSSIMAKPSDFLELYK